MTTTVRKFAVGVATAALVAGVAAPAMAADLTANRLAGETRYETAYQVALHEFPSGASVAYVARGDNLVDAITAGQLSEGPLFLLNDDADLQAKIKTYLSKTGVGRLVVIGGEKAISDDIVKAVLPTGMNYERVAGETRYETAAMIAKRAAGITATNTHANVPVYLANGASMVDALVGGQLINGTNGVLLLTDGSDNLPAATAQAINKNFFDSTITALGGVKAVSDAALTAANVAKVILPDSYLNDFQAEIKAVAEARLKVEGWYSISARADKQDVLDMITAAKAPGATADEKAKQATLDQAEAIATWPKVPTSFASTYFAGEPVFVPTKAEDGTVNRSVEEPSLVREANQWESATLEDTYKSNAVNYKGTAGNLAAANAAVQADALNDTAVKAEIAKFVLAARNNLTSKVSQLTATAPTTATLAVLTPYLPDVTVNTTLAELGEMVSYTFPAYNAKSDGSAAGPSDTAVEWLDSDAGDGSAWDTSVSNALKAAITAKVNGIVAQHRIDLASATSDNKAAVKALAAAQDVLNARMNRRLPGFTLNRLGGADRYATSVEIAKKVYGTEGQNATPYIYFANGKAFADAAVSGLLDSSASGVRGPVLLVERDSVPSSVLAYAKTLDKVADYASNRIFAIGGPVVISDANLQNLVDTLGRGQAGIQVSYTGVTVDYKNSVTKIVAGSDDATVSVTPRVANPTGNVVTTWQYYNTSTGKWTNIQASVAAGADGLPASVSLTPNAVDTITDRIPADKKGTLTVASSKTGTSDDKVATIRVRAYTKVTDGANNIILENNSGDIYVKVSVAD